MAAGGPASVLMNGGRVVIENGSRLKVEEGLRMTGGKLSTVRKKPAGNANEDAATIEGNVYNEGADIVLNDGSSPHSVFGVLSVLGNVNWTGGAYRPVVEKQGLISDEWIISGGLTVGGNALVAPGVVNANGVPTADPSPAGTTWAVIKTQFQSGTGIPPVASGWERVGEYGDGPIYWTDVRVKRS